MAMATSTAILLSTLATAGAGAAMAEEQRKSASKAATKARQQMGEVSPAATAEAGGDAKDLLRGRKTSGRASTIRAGSLIPDSMGKKTLLG